MTLVMTLVMLVMALHMALHDGVGDVNISVKIMKIPLFPRISLSIEFLDQKFSNTLVIYIQIYHTLMKMTRNDN